MKALKYHFSIFLAVLTMFILPAGSLVLAWLMKWQIWTLVIVGVTLVLALALFNPLRDMRVKARRDVEYDEFGVSKRKGHYEYLSQEEREEIDLKKTADMERLLSSTAIKKMTKAGPEDPMGALDELIGLEPVKEKVREMAARMEFEAAENKGKKKKAERLDSMSGRHMVFYGNAGTGKTSIARIITGFLYKYGYIAENKCVEVDGNFLKAGLETATKTELVIRQSFGGVLFVDEAYALMDSVDGCGDEAVATLIKQMEDNRHRFILILAGYTDEMKDLIQSNPGFQSRIKEYLVFPDYSINESEQIFEFMAKKQGFTIDPACYENFDKRMLKEKTQKSFGNARTVRNILDETIDKHALNLVSHVIPKEDRYVLRKEDVSPEMKYDGMFSFNR